MKEKVRAHIIFSGFVQGVFFRANTRKKAKELEVTGWIKNSPSGKVEAVFEGERDRIQKIIEWAKKGPQGAQVDDLELDWQEYRDEFNNFEIKYF